MSFRVIYHRSNLRERWQTCPQPILLMIFLTYGTIWHGLYWFTNGERGTYWQDLKDIWNLESVKEFEARRRMRGLPPSSPDWLLLIGGCFMALALWILFYEWSN